MTKPNLIKPPAPLVKTIAYDLQYTGLVRQADENATQRLVQVHYAFAAYSFLLPTIQLCRLCYFGEQVMAYRECAGNTRSKLVADLLIVNSYYYAPFYRHTHGRIL